MDLSRDLERCNDIDSIILCAQEKIYKLLKEPVVIYTVDDEKISKVYNYKDKDGIELEEKFIGVDEQAVVSWVIKNKRRAGANTDTLPGAKLMYTPLVGEKKVMAVVGIVINSDKRIDSGEKSLFAALLNQISFAIEKFLLNESQKEALMQAENERFRANLLRAVFKNTSYKYIRKCKFDII